jgi:hypothetical protein
MYPPLILIVQQGVFFRIDADTSISAKNIERDLIKRIILLQGIDN